MLGYDGSSLNTAKEEQNFEYTKHSYIVRLTHTDLILFSQDICLVNEDLKVQIGMLLVCRNNKIYELLDGLLIQVLQ